MLSGRLAPGEGEALRHLQDVVAAGLVLLRQRVEAEDEARDQRFRAVGEEQLGREAERGTFDAGDAVEHPEGQGAAGRF